MAVVKGDEFVRHIFLGLILLIFACGPRIEVVREKAPPAGEVVEYEIYRDSGSNKPTRHGRYLLQYKDGTYKVKGHYTHGKPSGDWVYFDQKGTEIARGVYGPDGNIQDGVQVYYHESGGIKNWYVYKTGELDGTQVSFWENGRRAMEKKYRAGKLHGASVESYENGQTKERAVFNNGRLDSVHTEYYRNGQTKKRTVYRNGELDGAFLSFWENGKIRERATFRNGRLDSVRIRYYRNGNTEEWATYSDGKLDGPFFLFQKNGRVSTEKHYKNGVLQRSTTSNARSGKISHPIAIQGPQGGGQNKVLFDSQGRKLGRIVDGKKEGPWIRYKADGTVWWRTWYRNGVEVKTTK